MNLETEITFGQNPNKETKLQNPVPSILRDEKGKVRWKLPENTEKENLCMGIRNVQGLFLEKYPEFNEMFPKDTDGKIAEIQRKEAMKFIFERIGTSKKFVSLLGGTALHKKDVPYFQGSHPFVMNKSFASWGIEFNLTTRKGKMEQFYSDEDGRWVTRGFLLSKYEVDKKTLVHYLKNVKRKNVNGSNLYNEGEALNNLSRFAPRIDLPKASKEAPGIIEINGIRWLTSTLFRKKYNINNIGRRFPSISFIRGLSTNGREANFYNEYETIKYVPRVNESTEIDIDEDDWKPLSYFLKKYRVGSTIFYSVCANLQSRIGTGRGNPIFYNEIYVIKAFQKNGYLEKSEDQITPQETNEYFEKLLGESK